MINLLRQAFGIVQQGMPYALADENLIIRASNAAMNSWVESNLGDLVGHFLPEAFPELVGLEMYLRGLLEMQSEEFTIAMINRLSADGYQRYFDLQIQPLAQDQRGLLLFVSDVTEQTHVAREQQQKDNERHLRITRRKRAQSRKELQKNNFPYLISKQ